MSVLESLLSTLPYPMLLAEKMKKPRDARQYSICADDGHCPRRGRLAGNQLPDGQHWLDTCAMLGLPEYGELQIEIMLGGPERAEFYEKAQPWLSDHTVSEIVELSQAMRIPASPVNDGATVLDCPQYLERLLRHCWWRRLVFLGPALRSGCRRRRRCRPGPHHVSGSTVRREPPQVGVGRRGNGSIEAICRHQSA